ncbi:protein phosphatase CheZ [Aerophototrophica crusticola]|uniref:Protein phosphatase CheZ n=2 Tax=Aerophototrophica crusticola TaxID=1709002 RepID=A0A858RAS6_9PROT|nr:protein phosphatase CheZ [Rhodospirillaceae bacterium B3]
MAASIEQARREVAALRPKDAGSNRLEIASNELDAIVSTTERASFDILQSAERLMDIGNRLRQSGGRDDICDAMEAEVMSIFTACSFQDLTGQRTSKVVNALRYVEQRVSAMLSIWNLEGVEGVQAAADTRPDAHLLGGPRSDGVNQDDVDALMSGATIIQTPTPAPAAETAKPAPAAARPVPLDQSAIDNLFD